MKYTLYKIPLPRYEKPDFPLVQLARNVTVHMMEVIDFLQWTVESDKLEIGKYLAEMEDDPFFLVAATGLGKTVGVPVHVLIRQIQRAGTSRDSKPKVWVIEPRIPIAIEQMEYMNHLWDEYRVKQSRMHKKTLPLFGCVTSASGSVNRDAPIQFVTTGIFEILSREGKLDPINDRVIIDEAHVTVEQNPGVELGIALCRRANVTVDYMSATVDVTGLEEALGVSRVIRADQQRNIIWKSNLLKPIDEAIIDLVEGTLVSPRRDSVYFPANSYRHALAVINSALETGRSHGMLIVVNSFNGDTSDTRKLTKRLRSGCPNVPVLHLASDVIRDPKRQAEFKTRLTAIESRKENYIIIATSVVEMGITFPTLDYVVTMDAGYDQETIGDVSFPVVAPLGVNSLLQRIGRVGRRHPGIAYISNEVGADYSSLEDDALNNSALKYEAIRYPLSSAPLMSLAYYALQQGWEDDIDLWLANLKLPSKVHEDEDRLQFFHEQFVKLEQLGIMKDDRLTELGKTMDQWIGRADIAYATQLQKRFSEGASREEVLFWIVATALSNTSTGSLRAQYSHFVDYDNSHEEVANRIDIWSGAGHEDIAVFRAVAEVTKVASRYFWNKSHRNELNGSTFYKWSNWAGIDARKFVKAGQAISDTIALFTKVNAKLPQFKETFGNERLNAKAIDWMSVYKKLPAAALKKQLMNLAGTTKLTITPIAGGNTFEWSDGEHGHVGVLSQDATPIKLDENDSYAARIIPGRQTRGDAASWRLVSLGVTIHKTTPPPPQKQVKKEESTMQWHRAPVKVAPVVPAKKRGFLDKLFGH